jgi:hypothetical protein
MSAMTGAKAIARASAFFSFDFRAAARASGVSMSHQTKKAPCPFKKPMETIAGRVRGIRVI